MDKNAGYRPPTMEELVRLPDGAKKEVVRHMLDNVKGDIERIQQLLTPTDKPKMLFVFDRQYAVIAGDQGEATEMLKRQHPEWQLSLPMIAAQSTDSIFHL